MPIAASQALGVLTETCFVPVNESLEYSVNFYFLRP